MERTRLRHSLPVIGFLAAIAAVLSLAACSRAASPGASLPDSAKYRIASDKDGLGSANFDEAEGKQVYKAPAGPTSGAAPSGATIPSERKLVKTGSVAVEGRDMAATEARAKEIVEGLGGYVSSSTNWVDSLSMELRVPQASFERAMDGAAGLGRIVSRSESVEDVSLRYADLESRIESKRILKDRYTAYLRTAKNVEDLLAVERSLNDVMSELDAMESQFRVLSGLIDYATIEFSARLPPEARPASERSFLGGLLRVWDAFKGFLYFLAFAIIVLVIFGVPSVLILGLLYFLCFGKIGLVRKFFRLLSGKRSKP